MTDKVDAVFVMWSELDSSEFLLQNFNTEYAKLGIDNSYCKHIINTNEIMQTLYVGMPVVTPDDNSDSVRQNLRNDLNAKLIHKQFNGELNKIMETKKEKIFSEAVKQEGFKSCHYDRELYQ